MEPRNLNLEYVPPAHLDSGVNFGRNTKEWVTQAPPDEPFCVDSCRGAAVTGHVPSTRIPEGFPAVLRVLGCLPPTGPLCTGASSLHSLLFLITRDVHEQEK